MCLGSTTAFFGIRNMTSHAAPSSSRATAAHGIRVEMVEARASGGLDEKRDETSSDRDGQDDTASDVRIEEDETAVPSPRAASTPDPAGLAIEYRFLTFETPLPAPNTSVSSAPSPPPPPPAPDLRAYDDPHSWPESRKNTLLALSCIATYLTAYAAGSFSPPASRMAAAFDVSLTLLLFGGITVFCLGFALAPMLLAPFSEYNGRYPVFVVAGCVFVVFQVVSGAAPDFGVMLVARLLVGVGGSVFSTMIGGVIADMWHAAERNTPMTLFSGSVLLGTGSGPLVAAVITQRTTWPQNAHDRAADAGLRAPWRWVFWHQAIADVVLMAALVLLFRESRGSVLLSRRAAALNAWYAQREHAGWAGVWLEDHALGGRPARRRLARLRWRVEDDQERTSLLHTVGLSVYRPFHMLVTEPVVFFFSLWVAFAWAILYLTFGSVFLVLETVYAFSVEQAGYAFAAMIVAAAVWTLVGLYQDALFLRAAHALGFRSLSFDAPESRLYVACGTSILLPVGLYLFGCAARPDIHWIVPVIGIGCATAGIFAVYLATFNYLADVYHRFASSALAAQSCCRNVLGGIFPLVMRALFTNLGNARAGILLGSIGVALTLVPWVLVFFGEAIRRRSRFAMVRLSSRVSRPVSLVPCLSSRVSRVHPPLTSQSLDHKI